MMKREACLYAFVRDIGNTRLSGIFAVRSIANNRDKSEFRTICDLINFELRRDRVVIGNSRNIHCVSGSHRIEGNLEVSNAIVLCIGQGAGPDIDLN